MMDVLGKGIKRAGTGYKNMNHVDKIVSLAPFIKQHRDY